MVVRPFKGELAQTDLTEVIKIVEGVLKRYGEPPKADFNLERLQSLVQKGWQARKASYLPHAQAVPGVPSVCFRLERDEREVFVPVAIGRQVLAFLSQLPESVQVTLAIVS